MVSTHSGANRRGLKDWLIQRFSAIYMLFYFIAFGVYFFHHPGLDYLEWQSLFNSLWVKIFTLVFILTLLYHSWIGMWTVFTDYVKCGVVRVLLNVLVLFALVGFFFAALLTLWSI
ncbi:MAG: succinate dehydrogenase, hydrophobic membrane anchor protein [Gammaproteobacteria bacterium]|nr:succinate dehydrogenase, hydrophobic membrane anchor protein [Gammaproteobacteria bacterium]